MNPNFRLSRLAALMFLTAPLASFAAPPELTVLQLQYEVLFNERVSSVFDAAVLQLNSNYFAGVDRILGDAKKSGDLQTVLALEEEIARITKKEPLPDGDEKAVIPLQKLRAIYRLELAKLEAQRATNKAAVLTPHLAVIKQLEIDLTKANRVAEAKDVMDYREGLAAGVPATKPDTASGLSSASIGATPRGGFTNSLGMKFAPVNGTRILMCIHETRKKDYAAYAAENPDTDGSWKDASRDDVPVSNEEDHPVVMVSWTDAQSFCQWLRKKEGRDYRLPTDQEWSFAVGIGNKEKRTKDTTPQILNGTAPNEFPWGGTFPPKTKDKSGNYADIMCHDKFPSRNYIEGYTDGFATTSPVMSFKPNKLGIYDMGGNVWEWVEDWHDKSQRDRTLRGSSFIVDDRGSLLSDRRANLTPTARGNDRGFRCAVVVSAP